MIVIDLSHGRRDHVGGEAQHLLGVQGMDSVIPDLQVLGSDFPKRLEIADCLNPSMPQSWGL
jgi:hypothetical protein